RRRSGRRRSRVARDAGSRAAGPELRALPSVEELASSLEGVAHAPAVTAAREAIAAARARVLAGGELGDLRAEAMSLAQAAARPSLRRVLNATGVIVH